jgi:hypothetical protein
MGFGQWDEPVQTFPAHRADHALTNSVHRWTARRGLQHPDPEGLDRLVQLAREDTVAIVNQEFVTVFAADHLTQLLQCPRGTRMGGDVAVDQSTVAMLDHHKHIQQTKCRCNGDGEVAGNDSLGVQAQKVDQRKSPLGRPRGRRGRYLFTVRGDTRIPIFNSNSLAMRSSPHAGFSFAIRRISARSSRGIGGRPGRDFSRQNNFHPRSVPAKQRLGTNDHQSVPPGEA